MPDAKVPILQLPTGTSSSADTDGSARSNQSPRIEGGQPLNIAPSKKKNQSNVVSSGGGVKKSRKSAARRSQKKLQMNLCSQQQKTATTVLHLKSQIPRALLGTPLTPAASIASLLTTTSSGDSYSCSSSARGKGGGAVILVAAGNSSTSSSIASSQAGTPRPQLQRQITATRLNFRARKSISQMDLKHARRTGAYVGTAPSVRNASAFTNSSNNNCNNNGTMVCSHNSETAGYGDICSNALKSGCCSQASLLDNKRCLALISDTQARCAGMRVFATIMLNAWRRRRNEVKKLNAEIEEIKRGSIKTKNQLHVYNSLFRVEQKRNDDLKSQFKRSVDDGNLMKVACDNLNISLDVLKATKAQLEEELQMKAADYDNLNEMLAKAKSDLFKSMSVQREMQTQLSMEQRKVQELENQKNELVNEICEFNSIAQRKQEQLSLQLQQREEELAVAKVVLDKHEQLLEEIKSKDLSALSSAETEVRMQKELNALRAEAAQLRECLSRTLKCRLKSCWSTTCAYQRASLQLLHLFVFLVLPAAPPPRLKSIPFGLSMSRVFNVIKH